MPRQSWTDDRLDDRFDHLEAEMDRRFKRVEGDVKGLREEIKAGDAALRAEMKEGNAELRAELVTLSVQFAALNRTLIQVGFGVAVTIVAGVLLHLV